MLRGSPRQHENIKGFRILRDGGDEAPGLLKSGAKASDDSMKSPCTYVFQTQNATDSEEAVALTYACINEAGRNR